MARIAAWSDDWVARLAHPKPGEPEKVFPDPALNKHRQMHLKSLSGSESAIADFWSQIHRVLRGEPAVVPPEDQSRRDNCEGEARGIDPGEDHSYSVTSPGRPGDAYGFYK